jgi:hypothetical protein
MATNGNFTVYWGDVYNYATTIGNPTINLSVNQVLGPGAPAFHTTGYGQSAYGAIEKDANCTGCSATGSNHATFNTTTDPGASTCKIYPRDPFMPPKPQVDLPGLKQKAKNIYVPGTGQSGAGLSSGESGYFYYSAAITTGPGPNSLTTALAGTGKEENHQYNSGNPFAPDRQGSAGGQGVSVLNRMRTNLGLTSSWVGNDDLIFFVDTQDNNPLASDLSNKVIGTENAGNNYAINFKGFAFRGSFILLGCYANNGPSTGPSILMSPPSGAWCPSAFTGTPDFNGFLYIGGNIESLSGTPIIYGSVDLEGDYKATGNSKVYYRSDFNYSLVESGTVAVSRWQEIKTFPTPLP